MAAPEAKVSDPGPRPGLCGGYLLLIIGEPHTPAHKNVILSRIKSGLLSWIGQDCGVNLDSELNAVIDQALTGDVSKNGERLIQLASDLLVTEILIHPQLSTVIQCIRNLLASHTQHKQVVYAGYTFTGNGSWILQDGIFTLSNLVSIFHEPEVRSILSVEHKPPISLHIHATSEGEGEWSGQKLDREYFSRLCSVSINPPATGVPGPAMEEFIGYLSDLVVVQTVEDILPPTQIVGNIRFTHPTLYVFPGGHGDAALFGINGFNMLIDGGFGRKACFWDFIRHLDRVDAMLMTRINKTNVCSLANVVRRKKQSNIHPQVGHFFCNLQDKKHPPTPDVDKDSLLIDVLLEGQEMMSNLKAINLKPQPCYRDANMEPINLYHKVGYGKLDMYVISPARDSREVKEFLMKWHSNDTKLFSAFNKKTTFPIQNLVSICALLVWQPANPNETITRLLFPGSAPQYKIFEGLEKIKHLEFLKYPVCTAKSLNTTIISNRSSSKTRTLKSDAKAGDDLVTKTNKLIEDLTKENVLKPEITKDICNEDSDSKKEEKEKPRKVAPKKEVKARVDTKITKKKPTDIKETKDKESTKSSPTSPKKFIDVKVNGIIKGSRMRNKSSPSSTPSKSGKDEPKKKDVSEGKKPAVSRSTAARAKSTTRTKEESKTTVPKKVSRRPADAKKDDKKANMKLENIKNETGLNTDSSTVSTPSALDNAKELKDHVASKVIKETYKITTTMPDKGQDTEEDEIMIIEKVEQDTEAAEEEAKEEKEMQEEQKEEGAKKEEVQEKEDETTKKEKDIEEKEESAEPVLDVNGKADLNLDLKPTHEEEQDKDQSGEKTTEELKDVHAASSAVKESSLKKTPGSELSSEVQKESDDKKDEKILSTVESGQTTTAPTLPEDERIPLDEIKEEKINFIGKKIDLKKETHLSKIQSGIVKTPDEVADLPVHEEVDATDYEDIEKKDEGIDEDIDEEHLLEEQESSTDIVKGSISFITTTRESEEVLNETEDEGKPLDKTDDEKIADEKVSEEVENIQDMITEDKEESKYVVDIEEKDAQKTDDEKIVVAQPSEESKNTQDKITEEKEEYNDVVDVKEKESQKTDDDKIVDGKISDESKNGQEKITDDDKQSEDILHEKDKQREDKEATGDDLGKDAKNKEEKDSKDNANKEESNNDKIQSPIVKSKEPEESKEKKMEETETLNTKVVESKEVVVEEPIYNTLKPDHAEFVTVTPDSGSSAPESPKKKQETKTDDTKTSVVESTELGIEEARPEQNTTDIVKETIKCEDVKIEKIEEKSADVSPKKTGYSKGEAKDQLTATLAMSAEGRDSILTHIENEPDSLPAITNDSKTDDCKDGAKEKGDKNTFFNVAETETKGDKIHEIKSAETALEVVSDSKDAIKDGKISSVDDSYLKSLLAVNEDTLAIRESELSQDSDKLPVGNKDVALTKVDQEHEGKTDVTEKDNFSEEKEKLKNGLQKSEPQDAKREGKEKDLDPTKQKFDQVVESDSKKEVLELPDEKVENGQISPPKSPLDKLDSRKTSTESLGNKSTSESILSTEQPDESEKELVALSQEQKLAQNELIPGGVLKSDTAETNAHSSIKELLKQTVDLTGNFNSIEDNKEDDKDSNFKRSENFKFEIKSDKEEKKFTESKPSLSDEKLQKPPTDTSFKSEKNVDVSEVKAAPKPDDVSDKTESDIILKSVDVSTSNSTLKISDKTIMTTEVTSLILETTHDEQEGNVDNTLKDMSGNISPSKEASNDKKMSVNPENSILDKKQLPTPPKSPLDVTEKLEDQMKAHGNSGNVEDVPPPTKLTAAEYDEKIFTPPKSPSDETLESKEKTNAQDNSESFEVPPPTELTAAEYDEKIFTPPKSPSKETVEPKDQTNAQDNSKSVGELPPPTELTAAEYDEKIFIPPKSPSEETIEPKDHRKAQDNSTNVAEVPQTTKLTAAEYDEKIFTPPKSPSEETLESKEKTNAQDNSESFGEVPPPTELNAAEYDEKIFTPPKSPSKETVEPKDQTNAQDNSKSVGELPPPTELTAAEYDEKIFTPPKSPSEETIEPKDYRRAQDNSTNVAEVPQTTKLTAAEYDEKINPPKYPSEEILEAQSLHKSSATADITSQQSPKKFVEISKEGKRDSKKSPSLTDEDQEGSVEHTNFSIDLTSDDASDKSSKTEKLPSPPKSPVAIAKGKECNTPALEKIEEYKKVDNAATPPKSLEEVDQLYFQKSTMSDESKNTEKGEKSTKLASPLKSTKQLIGEESTEVNTVTRQKSPKDEKTTVEEQKDTKAVTPPNGLIEKHEKDYSASKTKTEKLDNAEAQNLLKIEESGAADSKKLEKNENSTSDERVLDKSKADKHETPPKSSIEKVTSPGYTRDKESVEFNLSVKEHTTSNPDSKSEISQKLKTVTPPTSPIRTSQDKVETSTSSELSNKEKPTMSTPPKSPKSNSEEKLSTAPKTSAEKSSGEISPAKSPAKPTDKVKISSKDNNEVSITSEASSEQSIGEVKGSTPPKSPVKISPSKDEVSSPTKVSAEKKKESEKFSSDVSSIQANGMNKFLNTNVHDKVDPPPKQSTDSKAPQHKESPTNNNEGATNGNRDNVESGTNVNTDTKDISSSVAEVIQTVEDISSKIMEGKSIMTEPCSNNIPNMFTGITNGISSSVAEVIHTVEDMSAKILNDVEQVTGLEIDISKTKDESDQRIEKTDGVRTSKVMMSLSGETFNTKTDLKTEVETKAVDKSSTNESQSTSLNVEIDKQESIVDVGKGKLQVDNRQDSKSSPTISINGSPEKRDHVVPRELSVEKTLSSTSSVKDEDSKKTTPAISPSISINGSPVKDIDKLTKEFSVEKIDDAKHLINGDVLFNGIKTEIEESAIQLKDVLATETSRRSSTDTKIATTKSDDATANNTITASTVESSSDKLVLSAEFESQSKDVETTSSSSNGHSTEISSSVKTATFVKSDIDTKNGNTKVDVTDSDATGKETSTKVSEERSETPDVEMIRSRMMPMRTSYIGAGDSSRSETPDSRLDDIEDDTPMSPVSMTSSFSPPPELMMGGQVDNSVLDNMTQSFIDSDMSASVMMSSFYGTLPGSDDNENIAFERALDEHRSIRGNDLLTDNATVMTTSMTTSINTVPTDTNGNANIRHNLNEQESAFIGQSVTTAQSTVPNDPIKDWGKPLGLPPPPSPSNKRILVWNPVEEWGRPLGLPSPVPLADNMDEICMDTINVELTPTNDKLTPRKTGKKDISGKGKRPDSPGKYKLKDLTKRPPTGAVYVDLAYIPHHGHTSYTNLEFFKKIRARHYVFSGIEPSKQVFNALLEAKQTWEDKDLETTIIPTYDTETLGAWVTDNEEMLTKLKIDLSPSASRCTINLQDHETSCSAYRLEF